jgi:glycoprotein-N-acetylgalactosamine 3-beta-galactosyltransferase
MSKNKFGVSFRLVLILFLGIILGISLSTIFLYPKKLSMTLYNLRQQKTKQVDMRNSGNFTLNQYNRSMAVELTRDIRVLCWVLTMPENHKKKAIHVKNTWGKRCNKLIFMSTSADSDLNTISLPVKETRASLWDKTRFAFQYIYNYHFDEADWFLKADDDS